MVPGASFCRACGARREEETCANCDAPLLPGAAFCRGCGTRLAANPAEPGPGPDAVTAVQPPPPPAPPRVPPPARASKERRDGSWRTPVLIALGILLLGAGVAAAIVITGGESGGGTTTVAENTGAVSGERADDEAGAGEASETDSNGLPRIGEGEMMEEVESLLVAYHEDVIAEDFRSAWALLSARKRQQDLVEYGYGEWKRAQASLSGYLAPAGLQASIDGFEGEGVVRVDVTGMGWSDPNSPCSEWSGLTWVRYEGGAWTYDPGYSTTTARRRTWKPRSAELLGADC